LTIAAHAWITFTFRWNSPGCTGVFTSAIAAMRIVVLVSPISLPGAAVPEAGAPPEALEPEALGDEPTAADVDDDDEQPAASAMTASALAAMTSSRVRRRPDAPVLVRDLSWPFQITMLRPHN
jgi:hypothetical protein